VRYGTFESKVKRFDSDEEASAELERRIAEKIEKGFEEV
jgi:predicted DNA-binding WGR domain protein